MSDIKHELKRWEGEHVAPVAARDEGRVFNTGGGGFPVKRLYTPSDLEDIGFDYLRDVGFPGEWPYTRGIDPQGYRVSPWSMIQYAGRGSIKDMNAALKQQLADGATGLDLAPDLPSQIGLDSDHPLARGEVGRVGVPLSSLADYEEIFEGIDVSKVHVTIQTNAQSFLTMAYLIALVEKQGGDPGRIGSYFQNDVLKEFIARGTQIFPPGDSMRLTTDVILWCAGHQPHVSPQMVCEYHMRDAGATPIQSMAMMLGNAMAYADWVVKRGGSVSDYLKQLMVFITTNHSDFFEEVARIRALRRLWAKLWKTRYGVSDPALLKCRMIEFQTGVPLTAQEPENNIMRTAISVLAGALSGVQVMGPRTFDEALGVPSDKALRLALRSQQVVAYETGVCNTIDPLAGSYYVEWLTDKVQKGIEAYLDKIIERGGMPEAIASGWIQSEIAHSAYEYQRQIERGERVVIGVNKFVSDVGRAGVKTYRIDLRVERERMERMEQIRANRDRDRLSHALEQLKAVARTENNIIPATTEAVRAYATTGEICDALRETFGIYRESHVF